jgi:hypothetical protein
VNRNQLGGKREEDPLTELFVSRVSILDFYVHNPFFDIYLVLTISHYVSLDNARKAFRSGSSLYD